MVRERIARWWRELWIWNQLRTKFNEHAVKLGYGGRDYLEAAILIAERCADAETQALRLRASNDALTKQAWRDGARLERIEKDLDVFREAVWAEAPGLTPAEVERLAILAEECGEAVRSVGKILRFGWESQSPYKSRDTRTNRVALEREIGSVRAIVNLMIDAEDLRLGDVQAWQKTKRAGLARWTLHQVCSMPREEQLAMMDAIRSEAVSK